MLPFHTQCNLGLNFGKSLRKRKSSQKCMAFYRLFKFWVGEQIFVFLVGEYKGRGQFSKEEPT